ncbi:uncharacterized protein TNCV_3438361 [Trichonephila clavipes]|nr:uncharacterized protein TNCV_3438361 [Trichonephila clavipes]
MAVVPEELAASYYSKSFETGEHTHAIENQILNLLQESKYSDDAKAKLLSQLLTKFQRVINAPKPPLRVTIEEPEQQETTVIARKETSLKGKTLHCARLFFLFLQTSKIYTSYCREIENA